MTKIDTTGWTQVACREDMTPAQRRECDAHAIKAYPAQRLAKARDNGYRTVAEMDAAFDYAHGGRG